MAPADKQRHRYRGVQHKFEGDRCNFECYMCRSINFGCVRPFPSSGWLQTAIWMPPRTLFRRYSARKRGGPEWVVTSPPYKHAFAILKRALRIGRVGVAFKLRLTFLEPTKTRGPWLKDNPPHSIVVLPRAVYRGRKCSSTEGWFIWRGGRVDAGCNKPAFFFSLPV